MNRDFSRTITFLRKERKLSQKQAAAELGISQALLSHYEKGIRECGLDFVVKAADYYNVTCDYLLGRTADREYELSDANRESASNKQSAAQKINHRLISSMINVIYDYTAIAKSRRLDRAVTNYIMLGLYKVFRRIYSANKNNPQEMFTIPKGLYGGYSSAAMLKSFADIESMTQHESESRINALSNLKSSPETLAEEYPENAGEIFNVIQQSENVISKLRL